MKLLVRNLAAATTEEKLESLFVQYGAVQSCNLVMDKITGKSKGFGFVEMPKPGEAKAAIKNLNGYKLAGNIIRVKKAESKVQTAEETQAEKPAKKEKTIETASKTETAEIQKNENNTLNIYGKIKTSDD
ncbi:RNA recognition motif domain-containing protein [Psychromonas sp.]|uniref:RNA recognition motif domain-containing protein n=1 Tax=Psychromonas sp. TaxID=1884585 RepID=UPI0035696F5D